VGRLSQLLSAVSLLLLCSATLQADSFFDKFIDPTDGQFDTSGWLIHNKGFLPVPIIITEPAVGPGLGLAGVFFHESEEDKEKRKQAREGGGSNAGVPLIPPSVSVLFGAYTENDTWLAGGAHLGVWKQDHIRYVGALARASVNLTFYGNSSDNRLSESDGLDFNGDGWFLIQEARFRLHDSDWFVGGRFEYISIDISFDDGRDPPGVDEDNLNRTETIGLGPLVSYDSRDNVFSPSRGIYAELEAMFHSGSFIGDFNYQKYKAAGLFYWDIHPKVVLGWRLDGRFAHGEPPFYALPYIDLRGIPALRYQGDDVLVTEIQARWNFHHRWSLVGFTGVGEAQDSFPDLFGSGDNGLKHTVGGGMRYLIARRLGLQAGFDVARGPEDTVFYLTVGSAWR
jgi:hypothetical protein